MHRRPPWKAALVALGLLLAAGPSTAGELSEADWKDARKQANSLMRAPGKRYAKQDAIALIGRDDSQQAAELLIKWSLRSAKLQQGELEKSLLEAKKDFEKVDKMMRRFYEKMPPNKKDDKNAWERVKKIYDAAQDLHAVEDGVRFSIGEALEGMKNAEAIRYLIADGLPSVQKMKRSEKLQVAIVRGLLHQPLELVQETGLALAGDVKRSKLRILAVNWIGQYKIAAGFDALVRALSAPEIAVRRASVLALQALDDRRAVKPLIDAMARADGQLNAEIDEVLHWFTGKSFEGSASVWKRWWSSEGAAWLAKENTERHRRKREELPGGTKVKFYGIPTESHHVVFVLDRSGSMKDKAGDKSIEKKKSAKKPRGPITGKPKSTKDPKAGKPEPPVAGDTKIEVAKNQLARSVDQLDKKVRFNIVFYSTDVQVWKEPPELMPSSKSNKEAAKEWFMKLGPEGPTLMFDALMKALEYADTIGEDKKKPKTGADTIFLLSDGSPTTADGKVLSEGALEAQYQAFMEKNKLYHCVVHTIGIGPGHNSTILRRLAKDTGGQYKAVGVD